MSNSLTTTTTNFLDYTGLNYSDIVDQIVSKLNGDSNFDNFKESTIAKMIVEIFAATTELTNYYIERRAEECFMDTAKLKSSVILLAKQLGYIISRATPATSTLKMVLKGPLPASVTDTDTIQIPLYTQFLFNGQPYLLKQTYTYNFTTTDIINGVSSSWSKEIAYSFEPTLGNYRLVSQEDINAESIPTSDLTSIDIIQGELKVKEILGGDNTQVGKKFQVYKILDTNFSNKYGSEDYGSVDNQWSNSALNVTSVKIGADPNSATVYQINRRSLISYEALGDFNQSVNVCVLKTALDENVELEFGDGNYASLGAKSSLDNIYINYLSTIGKLANQIGVSGSKIQCQSSLYASNDINKDISSNVIFYLNSNIINGTNIEEIESIKLNSPGCYYALDRLVTAGDYINYLKSLTNPIDIRNAIAWGEQEEGGQTTPISKLRNVALFSACGSLYNTNADIIIPKTIDAIEPENNLSSAVLDDVDNLYGETSTSYFNIYIRATTPQNLGISASADVNTVISLLDTRSQLTVRNVYLSPFIRDYKITGSIYVNKLADAAALATKISNKVYGFLDTNADFNVNVYLSNIIEQVESFKEVTYTDLSIVPADLVSGQETFNLDNMTSDTDFNAWAISGTKYPNETANAIITQFNYQTFVWWTTDLHNHTTPTWSSITSSADAGSTEKSGITEWSFDNQLMRRIYDGCVYLLPNGFSDSNFSKCFAESSYFQKILAKMRNSLLYHIRYNIMDSNKNLINYSVSNEIPKFTFSASVIYK